ncbi:MAG: hypothetical protein HWE25_02305 [Alphaproteobacteria bacterium]|nr:hypothetical protein [Alphaproteobacteria bacterium]
MIRTTRKEALQQLSASHEFEAIRQFLSADMYDYFSVVLKLFHTPAHR